MVLAACSPLMTWISGFPSSCCCPEAPAPPPRLPPGPWSECLDVSRLTGPVPPTAPHAHVPPHWQEVPVFFAFSECLVFLLSLKIIIALIFFHTFLLFLKDSFWPCGLWPSPPFLSNQGLRARHLPGAHPSPLLFSLTS